MRSSNKFVADAARAPPGVVGGARFTESVLPVTTAPLLGEKAVVVVVVVLEVESTAKRNATRTVEVNRVIIMVVVDIETLCCLLLDLRS